MKQQRGFTLVEISVVLMIVTLLIGGSLGMVSMQLGQQKHRDTQKTLNMANDALEAYALANQYLPCPDTDGDLQEDRTGGQCDAFVGRLPTAQLGLMLRDAWGNDLYYAVEATDAFTDSSVSLPNVTYGSAGDLEIEDIDGSDTLSITDTAVYVVVSFGKNGAQTWSAVDGGSCPAGGYPAGALEQENCNGDRSFNQGRVITQSDSSYYDDHVVWLPAALYVKRLADAGLL